MTALGQNLIDALALGSLYALIALGITLVYKATRVPNFAHGAVGTVGAYVFFKTWNGARGKLQIPHLHFKITLDRPSPKKLNMISRAA